MRRPLKEWFNSLMKTHLISIGSVAACLALPLFAQTSSPFQPQELKAINEQPLVPPQGVLDKPKPSAPETAPKRIIIGPNYTSDQRGEAEAKALEEDSAQPMSPREGLITIPF